jgi:hydrogenase large subunit
MPIIVAAIDPVTRIEGHLKVDVEVDTVGGVQQVTGVRTIGTLFRGFEKVLEGRDPRDAAIITSRICGVCPTSHAQAAVLALEDASGMTVPAPARILRNLVHGACFLESHILHFYLLSLPDYIQGLGMPPWTPGFEMDRRVDKATSELFTAHYLEAITLRRRCHEIGALFGGKLPHTPAFIAGGFTAVPTQPNLDAFASGLDEILNFINTRYLPDVERLSSLYSDYFFIGRGYGNLLSYGAFELDSARTAKFFQAGRIVNGAGDALSMDTASITEDVTHSWYRNADSGLNPSAGESNAEYPKAAAYSWLKAPRYGGTPHECGPLARMWVTGDYTNGVSVMDRIRARAFEAQKIANGMKDWLAELLAGDSTVNDNWPSPAPASVTGVGLTEAPRGALGHWLSIGADGKLDRYQVITPTCWTISPRDGANQLGPLEQALLGTPVANVSHPVEALRVIHSVDPCLDCATHVMYVGDAKLDGLAR